MRWSDAEDAWRLTRGVRREFRAGQPDRAETFRDQAVRLPERYQDFAQVPRAPDVMNYAELSEYIGRLRDAGHKVEKYLVDLYSKIAFPLAHPIMVLVGIPFALQSPRGGRVIGIALCLALGLGYFIVHSAAVALARTEILPPLVAAWSANALVRDARVLPLPARAHLSDGAGGAGPRPSPRALSGGRRGRHRGQRAGRSRSALRASSRRRCASP